METTTIAVAYGDGIGPEIMNAVLYILKEAKAKINIEAIEIGEKLYKKGFTSGISKEAWEIVERNKILLKAPITTPQGKGYKSLNVTFRKALGLFANVRPAISYYPFIDSKQEKMDLVVIRENEEDLYAGIEYKLNANNAISYKIITRQGSERIIRYAFEYARLNNRKKVTALIKDNIMKIADGMFHEVFDEVAKEYTDITAESMIVDIGSARVAARPQSFDVVVTLNLYGDIISDIAAEVSGSVGLAGSANIGQKYAMFEAVHGSAPDIAGKNIANPSGLLNAAILMLQHLGQMDVATTVYNAWLKTIEDGIHTQDIYKEGLSTKKATTKEFAENIMANIGKKPKKLKPLEQKQSKPMPIINVHNINQEQELIGVDVYINTPDTHIDNIAKALSDLEPTLQLHIITQKGLKIWPNADMQFNLADLICCRFIGYKDSGFKQENIINLLERINALEYSITTMQSLYTFDGKTGFTLAQGE